MTYCIIWPHETIFSKYFSLPSLSFKLKWQIKNFWKHWVKDKKSFLMGFESQGNHVIKRKKKEKEKKDWLPNSLLKWLQADCLVNFRWIGIGVCLGLIFRVFLKRGTWGKQAHSSKTDHVGLALGKSRELGRWSWWPSRTLLCGVTPTISSPQGTEKQTLLCNMMSSYLFTQPQTGHILEMQR